MFYFLYCDHGRSRNYLYIQLRSPDTHVFYIFLYYAITMESVTILFDTGTGNKKRLINFITRAQSLSQQHTTALMALIALVDVTPPAHLNTDLEKRNN